LVGEVAECNGLFPLVGFVGDEIAKLEFEEGEDGEVGSF